MAVEWLDVSSDEPRVAYTATAGQTVFPVPFAFLDEDHLAVYINDTLKTLSTHYITSGAEDEDGGTVTLVTGATLNDSVVIQRDIPVELATHIPTSGPLDIPALNLQFSLIVMMLQQVADAFPRSLQQPASDADDMDTLPAAAGRALKYLFFDADGQPTAVASVSTSVAALAFWVTVLSTTNSQAAARTALGIVETEAPIGIQNYLFFQ